MGESNSLVVQKLSAAVVAIVMLSVSTVALAQEAQTDDPQVEARESFAKAQQAYEAKDFENASTHFQKAYDLKPHPSALKMIAECKLQIGELPAAVTIMEQLLEDPVYEKKKKKKLKRRLVKVKKSVGAIVLESSPAGAVLSLNGVILDEKTPTRLYVNPGKQNVVFLMEGYPEQAREVKVAKRAEETIVVDYAEVEALPAPSKDLIDPFEGEEEVAPEPVDEDPELVVDEDPEPMVALEEESDGAPKAFWAAAAIAGVGVVSGTVFGTMALRDQKDYEDTGDSATRDSGSRAAVIADISFGVAIGAAIAGTIILIANKNKKEKASLQRHNAQFYFSPNAGKNAIGLTTGLSF